MGRRDIDAYHTVYAGNTNTGKKQVYDLKRRPEVAARIEELREHLSEIELSVSERRRYLARLIRHGAEDSAALVSAKVRALELDARLAGELQPKPGEKKHSERSLEAAFRRLMFDEPKASLKS